MDYYAILELTCTQVSPKQIKKQFHALSLKTHPDKHPDINPELFRNIKEAYDVLSDPVRKQAYDATLRKPTPTLVVPFIPIILPPVRVKLTLYKKQLGTSIQVTYRYQNNTQWTFNSYFLHIPIYCIEKNMMVVPNIGNQVGQVRGEVHFIIEKIIDQELLEREREKQRIQFESILQSRRLASTFQNRKVYTTKAYTTNTNYLMHKKSTIRMNAMNEKFTRHSLYQALGRT